MQQTTYYKLSQQEYGEAPDVALINGNMDVIDTALHRARTRTTDVYSEQASYKTGDFAIYQDALYRCIADTSGVWDVSKWQATTIAQAFEPRGTWELFETITADGNTKRYDRTLTEKISGLFIVFSVTATTATDNIQIYAWFKNESGAKRAGYVLGGLNTAARYSHTRYTRDGNMWMSEQTSAVSGNSAGTTLGRNANGYHFTTEEMDRFRIDTDGLNFPTGSTITIYIKR